jgi:Flp pilus assembly secretin CpaC
MSPTASGRLPARSLRAASRILSFYAGALLLAGLAYGPARAQDKITVKLDQAQILKLPPRTSIVVLGNPIIADVTLLKKSGSMILTGKSYGRTNLLALDAQGQTLGQSVVEVVAAGDSLIVQLGSARQSYSCDPRCQPTFALGDDTSFTGGVSGQITSRNTLAQPSAH